jgi:uncharacterized protein involved in response to NO
MAPVPRLKSYKGPALLSYGFRPFFLAGSLFAAVAVAIWLPQYFGEWTLPTAFTPLQWHIHEMVFGFLPAVITGFLLTAVPNWTGQLPLQGRPLLILVSIWLAGRIAILMSGQIGWASAMIVDCAFLASTAAAISREIIAGKNWRNLKVVGVLSLLLASNLSFHIEAHLGSDNPIGGRAGIAAAVLMIMLIGGRIIPSFTRNWLVRLNPGRLPAGQDAVDGIIVAVSALGLAAWAFDIATSIAGPLLLGGAVAQFIRLARWVGWRARRDPLVLILHVAYAFVPIGFLLTACNALHPDLAPASAGVHAWTMGAIGGMTMAVMTRTSLGHTGRELRANITTTIIYTSLLLGVGFRIAAAVLPRHALLLLHLAALAWIAAFVGFAIVYGPLLSRHRA